jgi:hypothetical protein
VSIVQQVFTLVVLAMVVACISWTVTHEAIFREPQEFCRFRSQSSRSFLGRKFFYLFTCEYCFSHYVAALFLVITRFKLLFPDWRGYVVSLFSLVWVANHSIGIYNRLRLDIKHEHVSISAEQKQIELEEQQRR